MIFAQMQATNPDEAGRWMFGAAAVMAFIGTLVYVANQVKVLLAKPPAPPPPLPDDRPVTQADLKKIIDDQADSVTQADINPIIEEQKYARERMHTLSQEVHNMGLAQAKQPMEVMKMIGDAIKPLQAKVDKVYTLMAAIGVQLKIPVAIDGETQ
jgi:hypothetical protein